MLDRYPDLAQDMPRNQNGGSRMEQLRCKTDLGLILDAIAFDIENGGNDRPFKQQNNMLLLVGRLVIFAYKYGSLYTPMNV